MLRIGGMSLWRLLFIVFGFWMVIILIVTMQLSSNDSAQSDKDKASLDRIELAEKTVAELKARNLELQRMLSGIIKSNDLNSLPRKLNEKKSNELLDNDGIIIDNRPSTSHPVALGLSALDNDLFLALSAEYKDLYNHILETWFLTRDALKDDKAGLQPKEYDHYRVLISHAERLRDLLEPMKNQYSKNLSETVFQRIHYLQNPSDCKTAKYAICDIGKGCGFGCQIHHVAYCMVVSYALQRTMHLNGKPWSYAQNGFSSIFEELGDTEKCQSFINENSPVDWNGGDNQGDIKVIKIPIVDSLHRKPEFMPMAIPEDFAAKLKAIHTQPFVWWVGHFLRYILRPLQTTCNSLQAEIETRFNIKLSNFSAIKPLVAIQVRRTDKLLSEAQFHGVAEYMKWVAEYYDQLEYKLGKKVNRNVYIATDEPSVYEDAKKEFPDYTFFCDPNIAKSASLNTRYSDASLNGILIDMFWLARSDFIVCTFSSQVCRLGFSLMQTLHGDAGDRFRSLDDIFYYGGMRDHLFEAVLSHEPANNEEIELQPGDRIHIAGNHWNGYSKGTNKRTGKHGLFPSYKARDVIYVAKMPNYSEIPHIKGFTLPRDSCLVV